MGEEEKARKELEKLQLEHKKLDERIELLISNEEVLDQLQLQRLKKHKLSLKDKIIDLQEFLCDDIIA